MEEFFKDFFFLFLLLFLSISFFTSLMGNGPIYASESHTLIWSKGERLNSLLNAKANSENNLMNIEDCHTYGVLIEFPLTMNSKLGRWLHKWNWRMGSYESIIISVLMNGNISCKSVKRVIRMDWYQQMKLKGLLRTPRVIDLCYSIWKPNKRKTGAERIRQ